MCQWHWDKGFPTDWVLFSVCTGELQVNVKGCVSWTVWFWEVWWGKRGETKMHCLLTIIQSTVVPSLGCDCASGQSPDSAHPFPEGKLWKPKTAAVPSFCPLSSSASVSPFACLCLSLAGSMAATMHQRELQNNARDKPRIWRAFSFFFFEKQ